MNSENSALSSNLNHYLEQNLGTIWNECFEKEINIYNRVYLEMNCDLNLHSPIDHGEIIVYKISGMYHGVILCQNLNSETKLQSEICNIMIGRLLTNLELKFNLTSQLSTPLIVSDSKVNKLLEDTDLIKMNFRYDQFVDQKQSELLISCHIKNGTVL